QRGIKGHVIIHPQRPEKLATVLPPTVQDILTPICVIFVGHQKPTREWLEQKAKPLVVHREYVLSALRWLKNNNPLYSDVEIDSERVNDLPVHGLLPHEVHHLAPDESSQSVTSRYDIGCSNVDREADHASAEDLARSEHVALHKVVLTDVDGRAPSKELSAAAVRHIKSKGGAFIEIPHGPKPVNEFCNPSLFPMIYPSLFPYGIGGFEDHDRVRPLSLARHVRHL
ncbi:hypothetical protein GY45DRAFT_1230153, partial [Cubamyces sp. BRFM 1775]